VDYHKKGRGICYADEIGEKGMSEEISEMRKKLREHEKRIKALEDAFAGSRTVGARKVPTGSNIQKLAENIKVSPERIEELFDIENNTLTLLKIAGEDDEEKTQKASLAILIGYKYFLGTKEVLAREVRRNVAESRIPVNNFATYLNRIIPSLIRRKGKSRSPKTTYKLTPLGEAEARAVLKKLCE
jgi:hypothetical protein